MISDDRRGSPFGRRAIPDSCGYDCAECLGRAVGLTNQSLPCRRRCGQLRLHNGGKAWTVIFDLGFDWITVLVKSDGPQAIARADHKGLKPDSFADDGPHTRDKNAQDDTGDQKTAGQQCDMGKKPDHDSTVGIALVPRLQDAKSSRRPTVRWYEKLFTIR